MLNAEKEFTCILEKDFPEIKNSLMLFTVNGSSVAWYGYRAQAHNGITVLRSTYNIMSREIGWGAWELSNMTAEDNGMLCFGDMFNAAAC